MGGRAKGLIQVSGRPIVQKLLELEPEWPTWIIANVPGPYLRFGVPIVADVMPGKGAPGGVVTALAVARTEWVLVVACDMPNVTRAIVARLIECANDDVDVVCFRRRGQLEPLLALYRRTLLAVWAEALPADPSMRALLAGTRVNALELEPEDDRLLDSLNTPDDIRRSSVAS
jgi:molybdopterin-guanine dinucleotide biosynthesis protein A